MEHVGELVLAHESLSSPGIYSVLVSILSPAPPVSVSLSEVSFPRTSFVSSDTWYYSTCLTFFGR